MPLVTVPVQQPLEDNSAGIESISKEAQAVKQFVEIVFIEPGRKAQRGATSAQRMRDAG
jgi:hypothetical protein